jgi:hypothetical protein
MASAGRADTVGNRSTKILLLAASATHALKKDLERFVKPLCSSWKQHYEFRKPEEVQRESMPISR